MGTHPSSVFSLWLLFTVIVIAIFLHHLPSFDPFPSQTLILNASQSVSNSTDNVSTLPRIARQSYIVRFFQYKRAEEHRMYLESNVRSKGWEWIERRNPAAKYPTDFGLVSIEDSVKEVLTKELLNLGLVKDVNLDMSYNRGLLNENRDKVGAFMNGKKRPGKIFTTMSFSEGNEDHYGKSSNSSVKWGRQLLMQVKYLSFVLFQVLGSFGAVIPTGLNSFSFTINNMGTLHMLFFPFYLFLNLLVLEDV